MKSEVARTWKSLTSKIHPPLPITPRTSQQLLSLLNASFKQQLDRRYPAPSPSSEDHANLHLQSILKHPLFDAKPQTPDTSTSSSQRGDQSKERRQKPMIQPIYIFKERVSRGTADLSAAKQCLRKLQEDCMASPGTTPSKAMQTSGATSTILQWLWSSGMEDSGIFLEDQGFVALLIPFLVAEGQQSCVLRWLQRIRHKGETPFLSLDGSKTIRESNTKSTHSFLFKQLIVHESRFGGGLKSALMLFLRVVVDLRSSGCCPELIRHYSRFAAWRLTIDITRGTTPVDLESTIIDAFLNTIRTLYHDSPLEAMICVFIQKPPDPHTVMKIFHNISAGDLKYCSTHQRPHIILLGLRAAELLLKDDRLAEAISIMEFLETNFTKDFDSLSPLDPHIRKVYDSPTMLATSERREEQNLSLLETLAVQ